MRRWSGSTNSMPALEAALEDDEAFRPTLAALLDRRPQQRHAGWPTIELLTSDVVLPRR